MPKKKAVVFWLRIVFVVFLVCLPVIISGVYRYVIRPNPNVVIAGGLEGGRYDEFTRSLVNELNDSSQLSRAKSIQTGGSYENLELLEKRKVDFALFQSGSDLSEDLADEHRDIVFVSNVFPEVAHLIVRSDITQEQIDRLDFSNVAVGVPTSGDYRVGKAVLTHFDLENPDVKVSSMEYVELIQAFQENQIEMAILTVGIGAEIVQDLIDHCNCRLIELPTRDAFLSKHVAYFSYTIPRGAYMSGSKMIPDSDLSTIAVNSQLLTHKRTPSGAVRELLKTLNHSRFLKKNRLRNLFVDGSKFATSQPEFPLHDGASIYYDPRFRPILNPDFVEATEGIRSFVVSGLIGIFFLVRWLRKRAERSQAHQLDEYIHRLLQIEQEQMGLDRDYTDEQISSLEVFLDEITQLRQEALTEFTAHDLKDDPAIECFISMSHALSEKIYTKLTRDAIRKI